MKQLIACTTIFCATILNAFAQTDEKAKAILNDVSKKYQTFNTIKADFSCTIDNPQAKIKDTQLGTLTSLPKVNKYRITLKGQEFTSDGKSQWTYLKADKEIQINDIDNNSDTFNPAKIFTIYEKGFKYLYVEDLKIKGKAYHIIDLVPLNSHRSFFKIRLQIDKASKLITNALIFEKDGNRYTYAIRSFTPNIKVAETMFTFDPKKYPGVEVVDLR